MSLKENIEQGRQELLRKEQEKKELEGQKEEQERQRVENLKDKALFLDEKARTLFEPYKSLIESSQCISILKELVQLEKLTGEKDGQWPKDAAKPKAEIYISYAYKENKDDEFHNDSIECNDMTMDDGFYLHFTLGTLEYGNWHTKKYLDGIDPYSLKISEADIVLKWDSYEESIDEGKTDYEDNVIFSTYYRSKDIYIFATPSSLRIRGGGEDGKDITFTKKNMDKASLEKSISKAYFGAVSK